MVSNGLLVRLQAQPGRDAELQRLLLTLKPLVRDEAATTAWFAVKSGRGEYGIFDVFLNEAGRDMHLAGEAAAALTLQGGALLAKPPGIEKASIVACKLPAVAAPVPDTTCALLFTFRARHGQEAQVENILRCAKGVVDAEARTTAWFGLRLAGGDFGVFAAFADNAARLAHLAGHAPRELTRHALSLLGGLPAMTMLEVVAVNFAERETLVGLGVD
ncbi:hypothetical protein FN976_09030 [Caenimonas sedimenti]|uniref:Antibiotic biosynthesis monooxygenase n=1 Tax=Caenimonas sedimenti TaxID=2596921 RepID=A0A562ZUC6_9BURK|nr:hypothetical protein [Caenimonas sedimenti]TWO71744.1 hypothetical protein FN976_09030 [Caenimonas sedimenti]